MRIVRNRSNAPARRGRGAAAVAAALAVSASVLLVPAAAHAAPVAVDDEYTISTGFTFVTDFSNGVLKNDTEVDQTHSLSVVTAAQHGTVKALGAGGAFRYIPATGFAGDDVFTYCVSAMPSSGVCLSGFATVKLHVKPTFERLAGSDRYLGAVEVSKRTFAPGTRTVYMASGETFPDALSASAVAGAVGSPVLLMTKTSIQGAVADELRRLMPQKIIVVGGENTISGEAMAGLGEFAPTVERVNGADRYAVSAQLSKTAVGTKPNVVYVASGEVFPDALSAGPAAGHRAGPVLLVQKGGVPDPVIAEIQRLKPLSVVVLGGLNTVSAAVVDRLAGLLPTGTPLSRIDGLDRYAVSAATSAAAFDAATTKTVYVAAGAVFPDALAGSPAAIVDGAPVLLVTQNAVPAAVDAELKRLKPTRIVVLGGVNTVSEAVATTLRGYLPAL
ncbi:MAG: cell wall-binding repeat-containing protein [Herbiconiux sp.]|nr:cell wall-binding repeat-containing protein [Herbiconiux sp.]